LSSVEQEKAGVINDDFRDAAFNRRYYSCLLSQAKRLNLTLDIIVAIGTSGAIAAWNIWQDGPGTFVWKSLASVATLVALIKPFLTLPKEIERYSELVAGWAGVFYDLKQITVKMRTSGAITDEIWCAFEPTQQRVKELGVKDDPNINKRLQRRCFEEIKQQIPSDALWWPEERLNGQSGQIPETTAVAG
jgi:hypothetical protein